MTDRVLTASTLRVRALFPADHPECLRIVTATMGEVAGAQFHESLFRSAGWVAEFAGQIVGVITYVSPGLCYGGRSINWLAVDESTQGHNVGTALISFLVESLKPTGLRVLFVAARLSAIGFFARNDFSPLWLGLHEDGDTMLMVRAEL